MDPVSVGLLAALAGGAGGEMGRQAWQGLSALVHRPFRHRGPSRSGVSSAKAELVALEEDPGDAELAKALSTALAARAALDDDFHTGLQRWHEQARLVRTGDGAVRSTINGGTFHGPVIQGRDFTGTSFAAPPPSQ